MSNGLNRHSRRLTQVKVQGASQAMLYATGLTDQDFDKPQVGIASIWYEGNSCNMHLNDLAARVKEGVTAAGLVGMRFNTIGVSDGISMGTDGMSYSLQSRDLIADSIETVMGAQWYDACIVLPGCDKNMPGSLIALGRLNRPGFMVYGGTIRADGRHGETARKDERGRNSTVWTITTPCLLRVPAVQAGGGGARVGATVPPTHPAPPGSGRALPPPRPRPRQRTDQTGYSSQTGGHQLG